MEQRLSLVTLGVSDLARARDFYEGVLGWKRMLENDQIAMYRVGGFVLSLFPHAELAKDIGVDGDPARGGYKGFTLALNLASADAVDAMFAELKAKGVTILKSPETAVWGGHSGYFADPDGHAIEVAYAPGADMAWLGEPQGYKS